MDTSVLLKNLLDFNLLFSGYEKDLDFLKSACKLVSLGKYKNKLVFDNYIKGLDGPPSIKVTWNLYVLLTFVPGITTHQTRDMVLEWLEDYLSVFHLHPTTIAKIVEFKEFLEFESKNQNTPSNIKW